MLTSQQPRERASERRYGGWRRGGVADSLVHFALRRTREATTSLPALADIGGPRK